MDVSWSMSDPAPGTSGPIIDLVRRGSQSVADMLPDASRVGVWVFGSHLSGSRDYRVMLPIGALTAQQRRAFAERVRELEPEHTGTGLYDTILAAYVSARSAWRPRQSNQVMVFTDGINDDDPGGISLAQLSQALKKAQDPRRPVQLSVVGFGEHAQVDAMSNALAPVGGYVESLRTADQVQAMFIHLGRGAPRRRGRLGATMRGMTDDPALDLLHRHYELGLEEARLDEALGSIELARTLEIAARVLPRPPAVVADIGGGPGRYALELAERGYAVAHRDIVPLHVEQLRASARNLPERVHTAVGDARDLDLDDDSVDAVLLLGPLYHLVERHERIRALREALRVARPNAPVLVSAISRWAPRLHGYLAEHLYERQSFFAALVRVVEESGRLNDSIPGWFTGYCHRPEELRHEVEEAGLVVEDLVGLEGLAFALGDLAERLADPAGREVVLDCARAIERVPELLGLSPHLLVVARAP